MPQDGGVLTQVGEPYFLCHEGIVLGGGEGGQQVLVVGIHNGIRTVKDGSFAVVDNQDALIHKHFHRAVGMFGKGTFRSLQVNGRNRNIVECVGG